MRQRHIIGAAAQGRAESTPGREPEPAAHPEPDAPAGMVRRHIRGDRWLPAPGGRARQWPVVCRRADHGPGTALYAAARHLGLPRATAPPGVGGGDCDVGWPCRAAVLTVARRRQAGRRPLVRLGRRHRRQPGVRGGDDRLGPARASGRGTAQRPGQRPSGGCARGRRGRSVRADRRPDKGRDHRLLPGDGCPDDQLAAVRDDRDGGRGDVPRPVRDECRPAGRRAARPDPDRPDRVDPVGCVRLPRTGQDRLVPGPDGRGGRGHRRRRDRAGQITPAVR